MTGTGYWAQAPQRRDQLVLFPTRLDEMIAADAPVRLLAELLGRLDFSAFEARYHLKRGQPPIHPRVLAGTLLYGLMMRVRASRQLEEALLHRIDFRWLAEGHTADHTTLSEFRRKFGEELQGLFVQIGLLARELGLTSLSRLAFDGTRVKANNRRSGTRTPDELRKLRGVLAARYAELIAQAEAEDAADDEQFGEGTPHRLPEELADIERRGRQIEKALEELERIEAAGEVPPKRIPLTDPQARVSPNKEGGFAVNYTPLAGVDVESGLIVTAEVIPGTDEEQHLVAGVAAVAQNLGVLPEEVLADGLFATGSNLETLEAQGVTLYSPVRGPQENPALREDPTQPVPASRYDQLPTKKVNGGKVNGGARQLDKAAFVYDAASDRYFCPQGEPLTPEQTTTDHRKDGTQIKRTRYKAAAETCAACPLKQLCLQGKSTRRQVSRDQFEPHRERLAQRMASDEGRARYARRAAVGERPFAVIKQHFGVRQFFLRGLERVRLEWKWITIAFNLKKLMSALAARAGPGPPPPSAIAL